MDVIIVEELKEILQFSEPQCNFLSENCIVALENSSHTSGCTLKVDGDKIEVFQVNWNSNFPRSGYKETKKIVEHAAETLSFFLTNKLTDFTVVEEAVIGTGFDYWLGYESTHALYDSKNFFQARLEVSGIEKEAGTNTVENRVKMKKNQTNRSDSLALPAYVSVIEFATPKAIFCKK